ncbi:3-oxoacyl-ACP reductase FabG [Ectopseudomonas oleovorans]|uniref:3-oxoacyl-ACP reductase FabG n=1 Tax=Ectopseudomonas oleovorans TaxID=301 RepID=A0AA42TT22_ECTOL|nr:3-oxoacyl-ACP reductase FabG [Pseudomonas oleovorans]MDH1338702.1 3-oxoacyl-ACP reductase FabG [Pseudomonas oleovorans]MDH1491668.1 3-oxoacyl-ACP reductase FabG [Pseudomonas oleovorans]WGG20609.1 3-oxoacyl-ACP reductase FabG [Pseudomonas oleovorans]
MFESLQGRVAIVTGATRGIGLGIAQRFAAAGIQVLVVSRVQEDADRVAARIGAGATGFAADVSDKTACQAMAEAAMLRYGQIDILAANAGIFPSVALADMTVEQFDSVMATNVRSTFLCTQVVLPYMKARQFGRIVLTSSITGPVTGFPGWSHYAASKAAQLGFMRTAALEVARDGITVNAVMPGNIRTEGLDGMGAEYQAQMAASIPTGVLGEVADIANAALFFASLEASFITGQGLIIDGGQVLPESAAALV